MPKVNKNRVNIIYKRDLKEYKSWKSYYILIAVFIILPTVLLIKSVTSGASGFSLHQIIYNNMFLLALIPPIADIPVFTTVSLTRDKANKIVANLLATPLNTMEIVKGKTKAVAHLGMIASVLGSLFFLIIINMIMIFTKGEGLCLSAQLLIDIFIISPIFCYGLSKITVELSLIKSAELAISPSYLIGLGVIIGIPLLSSMGYINLMSWGFTAIYLLITCIVILLTELIATILSKEKIITYV